jgi:hypothetical protein
VADEQQPHAMTGSDELSGREAVQWLLRRRGEDGPHLIDTALVAVTEAFGLDARIAAFVPIETPRGRRWRFFLVVDGSPSNDDDWRRLHRTHEVLISREEWLTYVAPNDDPYARFHVVLAPDREDVLPIREAADQWLRQ